MISHKLIGALVMVGVGAFASGCAAHGQAHANVSGTADAEAPVVFVGTPTLVAIDSGVWVVRDADRPVYYVEDNYWVVRDGTWYRSRSYEGGWVMIEASVVPSVIVTRNHTTYVHYKGEATAQTRPAPRDGETLTSANVPTSIAPNASTPPGHDDIPGKGNQRKADGEQPGHASHAGALANNDQAPSNAMPGVGNERKAEGAQPGHVPGAKKPSKAEKPADKKTDKPAEKKPEKKTPEKKDEKKPDAKK
jgi:hypothetical protein